MSLLTENQKAFKRLLKEIGIYSIWVKHRKEYLLLLKKNVPKSRIIPFNKTFYGNSEFFVTALRYSFEWRTTNNPFLWADLAIKSGCCYARSKDILKNESLMKNLKYIVYYNVTNREQKV